MRLDVRTASLIAVGASIAANCQPCLEINASRARDCGLEAPEIDAAIEIGRKVRAGAAAKMDAFAERLGSVAERAPAAAAGCGCAP